MVLLQENAACLELQHRALTAQVLPDGSASRAAGSFKRSNQLTKMGKRSNFERPEDQHIFRLTSTEIARSDRILKNRLGVVGRQVCNYSPSPEYPAGSA
jgi:hypothetical protein